MAIKLPRRLATAFLAPWVVLILAELPAIHVCQVHNPAHASMEHDAPAMSHSHHSVPASGEPSHHHDGKNCSCLDTAAHSPMLALAARALSVVPVTVVATTPTFVPVGEESLPGRIDFRTPFPIGPPANA
ncbi:MAG: hypothetical protein ABJC63_12655 [Gemmatimonadales bacterium]